MDVKELNARQWLDAREAQVLFPVKPEWVRLQSQKGFIRSAKLGPHRSSRRVFAKSDIEGLLTALSELEQAATGKD